MEDVTNFLWGRRSLKNDIFIKPPRLDKKKERAHTYASFGDDGLTVSINAYGHIMQISRYLNFGYSGFLCVDSQYPPPYYVQNRMDKQLESSRDPKRGLRINIVDWKSLPSFSFGFMYDRWPRYVLNQPGSSKSELNSAVSPVKNSWPPIDSPMVPTPGCSLSIQYYCSENTVIQKYQILVGDSGISHDKINWGNLSLIPQVCIRTLHFIDELDFDEDEEGADIVTRVLSDSSIMLVRPIPEVHFLEEKAKQQPKENDSIKTEESDESPMNPVDQPIAAALIISPFINDQPASIVDGTCIKLERIEVEAQIVITIAYTIKMLYSNCEELFRIQEPAMDADSYSEATSVNDAETTQESAPESDTASEPGSDINATLANSGGTGTVSEPIEITIRRRTLADAWAAEVLNAMQEMGKVFCSETTFRRICFSPIKNRDYAFRRNLEHILSVCSIPIAVEQNRNTPSPREPAIAITCGDISGHRIGPRASL
jgi:hypothetical protein